MNHFNKVKSLKTTEEISITWPDTSQNENGFEIWRKLKDAKGKFSVWEMPVLANAVLVYRFCRLFSSPSR